MDFFNDNLVKPVLTSLGPVGNFVNDHLVQSGIGFFNQGIYFTTNLIDSAVDTTTHLVSGAVTVAGNLLTGNVSGAWGSLVDAGQTLLSDLGGVVVESGALLLHGFAGVVNGTLGLSDVRPLTAEEQAYLETIYGDSVDYSEIQIQQGGIENFLGADPHAIDGDIYLPDSAFAADGSLTPGGLALLSHEVGHTWQSQNEGAGYISEAVFSYLVDRPGAYDYVAALDGLIPWDELTPDQQAEFAMLIGLAIAIDPNVQVTAVSLQAAISAHTKGNTHRPISPAELNYVLEFQQQLLAGNV